MPAPARAVVLVNPAAGGGRGAKLAQPVADRMIDAGSAVDLLLPDSLDDARSLAADRVRTGVDALVVVGGDGMVHLGVNAVGETGTGLAIVPCGTGNDYARTIGLSARDPMGALDAVCAGTSRQIDVVGVSGTGGDRLVATVVAVGFDSRVAARANAMGRLHGHLRYLAAVVGEMRGLTMTSLSIDTERPDQTMSHDSGDRLLVAIGVTPYYGGGLKMLPGADPTDGLLDVVEIHPVSRRTVLRLFPHLYRGTHTRFAVVSAGRARSVTIRQTRGEPVEAVGDGEPLGGLPLTLTCRPGLLRLFA
jgi:diacylglycerol kinase (ATP)